MVDFCEANNFIVPPQQSDFAQPSMDEIVDALVNDTVAVHEDYLEKRLLLHIPPRYRPGRKSEPKCKFCIREEQRAHADPNSLRYRGCSE